MTRPDPYALLLKHREHPGVASVLKCLSSRQRMVVELRFGIGDNEPHTLMAIARKCRITRERVRAIQESAMDTLGAGLALQEIEEAIA